jgi:phosphatidylserine/phosphatidylglycerophosphate/cardiolipin synthase-like enzyme
MDPTPLELELLDGEALHERVIQDMVLNAKRTVWIATANLKDMRIPMARGFRPALEVFDRMAAEGVQFRIIHSDLPSRSFRNTLEKLPRLTGGGLELQACPRCHWKMVVVDGKKAYAGSANFTGAGLGAKKAERRNLELGMLGEQPEWVKWLEGLFDGFWIGKHCKDCQRRDLCPDPIGAD